MANNLQKATYVIDKNQQAYKTWKAQQRTWQGGEVYEKSQVKNKQTCSAHNKLYPTTNSSNYFSLLAKNDEDDVTVIRSNCVQDKNKNDKHTKNIVPIPPATQNVREAPNAETMLNASNNQIAVDLVVTNSGAMGHFILLDKNISNMKISKKPLPLTYQTAPNWNQRTHVILMSQGSLKKPDERTLYQVWHTRH